MKKIETIEISGVALGIVFILAFTTMMVVAVISPKLVRKDNKQKLKKLYS